MALSLFIVLILPCIGMSTVLGVYIFLLCYTVARDATTVAESQLSEEKALTENGLSVSELEKLPKITGGELKRTATDCAICLDEIERSQLARLLPGCNHGFHLHCADAWLSKNPNCPVCRAKLEPEPEPQPEILNPCEDIC